MDRQVAPSTSPRFTVLGHHGPNTAVAWRAGTVHTAAELRELAGRLAGALPEAKPAEQILLLCEDRWFFTAALLAAWHRGFAVALPPNLQAKTIEELSAAPGVRGAIHDGNGHGVDARAPTGSPVPFPETLQLPSEREVAVVYSSGTTGKSVAHRKVARQLLAEAEVQAQLLAIDGSARVLATAPPQHIYGLLIGILTPLVNGAAIVCGRALLPEAVAALAREAKSTHLVSVPAHLRGLATGLREALPTVHTIVSSSAPLERELGNQIAATGVRPVELFGSTETGGIGFREPPSDLLTPLPGVSVTADVDGRLRVDSPFLDAAAVRPLETSDRIALAPDGKFVHLGRGDGIVKVGGRRVALQELEAQLRAVPSVRDAAVAAFPARGDRGSEIWAMLVAPGLSLPDLRRALLAALDPVVMPRRVRFLEILPREPSGKITQAAWREAFEEPTADDVMVHAREVAEIPGGQSVEIRMGVPRALTYFRGHFDGFPILSGVFILHRLVALESKRQWGDLGHVKGLSQVKFRRPIFPEAELTMTLRRAGREGDVEFHLLCDGQECSSGAMLFTEGA